MKQSKEVIPSVSREPLEIDLYKLGRIAIRPYMERIANHQYSISQVGGLSPEDSGVGMKKVLRKISESLDKPQELRGLNLY